MDGPRLHILNILQRQNRATVGLMARELGLASATVRRHLDILQRDHLITFGQVKKKTGRPEYTYYLTESGQESLPKDYSRLLGRLLHEMSSLSNAEIGDRSGYELLQLMFQRMALQTAARAGGETQDSFPERVSRAVAILQEEKFEPEIEETNGVLRIQLHNCPFRSVVMENDSVCGYDGLLLSTILGTDVVLEKCVRDDDGACCYRASLPVQQG